MIRVSWAATGSDSDSAGSVIERSHPVNESAGLM